MMMQQSVDGLSRTSRSCQSNSFDCSDAVVACCDVMLVLGESLDYSEAVVAGCDVMLVFLEKSFDCSDAVTAFCDVTWLVAGEEL